MKPMDNANLDTFYTMLREEYVDLFANDPAYAYSAAHITPDELARKMTLGLDQGTANKSGDGVKRVCKKLGIPYTYRAIRAYLSASKGKVA